MCTAVKTFRFGKFDLNPRGNLWARDENKLGQKLLSRMGWSEGKGLGKNENGTTEGIKVRMKVGHSGVGFTEKLPLGIENHEYDAVLESLNKKFKTNNETTKTEESLNGLEYRSQQFKKRLHYRKFVRGKDVGRYSEKDMNSIFVSRKPDAEPAPSTSNVTNADCALAENSAPESLPTFKSQLSMNDYFAMKLKKKCGEVPQSNLCILDSQNIENTSFKNEVSNKKRKKEPKNNSKTSKKLKSMQSDTPEIDSHLSLRDVAVQVEELSETSPEMKKEKNRKSKLVGGKQGSLKSCLKSKVISSGLWFKREKKEVSFNDSISYKVIENDALRTPDFTCRVNSDHSAADCFEVDECVLELAAEGGTAEEGECVLDEVELAVEDARAEEGSAEDSSDNYANVHVEESAKSICEDLEGVLDSPKCFDIPKCDNSNYNTWLESQRIAIKMKLYKNMVKKIRKNPVLRTSNLLDVKGYGNWGF